MERFCQKNTHVNYQSSNTHYSKVIIKVKVSKKQVKLQQGYKVKNVGTHKKVLSLDSSCKISNLQHLLFKGYYQVNVSKKNTLQVNSQVTAKPGSKMLVPTDRSCHQIYSCDSLFVCLFGIFRPTLEFFTYLVTSTLPVKGYNFFLPILSTHGH